MNERINEELENAIMALKIASDAFDAAMDGMHKTMEAIKLANHAQGEAIDAIVKAIRENK